MLFEIKITSYHRTRMKSHPSVSQSIPVLWALPHRRRHGDRLVDRHVDHLARGLVLDLLDVAADGVELKQSLCHESMFEV